MRMPTLPVRARLGAPFRSRSRLSFHLLSAIGQLRMLMLGSACVDDAIVALLARIDSLRALQIAKARLSIDGVKTLASMARLEALSLREQDLPPGTCAVLASTRGIGGVSSPAAMGGIVSTRRSCSSSTRDAWTTFSNSDSKKPRSRIGRLSPLLNSAVSNASPSVELESRRWASEIFGVPSRHVRSRPTCEVSKGERDGR